MTLQTCPDCKRDNVTGKSSVYCWTCYKRRSNAGTLPPGHTRGDMRHRLSNVDGTAGVCSICGPVDVYIRASGVLTCMTKRREENARTVTRRHTITPTERAAIVEAQGGGCGICGTVGALRVDHDHACCPGRESCGKCVRGMLCHKCNAGIGMLGDTAEKVQAALDYLRRV